MEGTQSILKIYGEQEEAGPFGGSFDICPPAAVAGHHMPSIVDKALSKKEHTYLISHICKLSFCQVAACAICILHSAFRLIPFLT